MLEKIISGGQTGADMAGLIAAKQCGYLTGGTAPKNYKTEDGQNIDLGKIYGLIDIGTYRSRTIKNICDSDGTIVFLIHNGSGGSTKTIGYCVHKRWINYDKTYIGGFRPVLVINMLDMEIHNMDATTNKIINWLIQNNIKILNVAGHRKTTAFQKPFFDAPPYDYQQRVTDILINVLRRIL